MSLRTYVEFDQMEARANAAEDDLEALRNGLKTFEHELRDGKFGPVIFRTQVADKLLEILDASQA